MPQVIVIAFAYASYGYYAWQFWAVVALTAYSSYQQSAARRKARNAYNDSLKDRLVSVPVSDAPRARVYGRARCADGIIYKATHGTNKENFTLVLALAGHEIDAVEQVYFNDVPVTLDGSGYVTTAPWLSTAVTSGRQPIGAGVTSTTLPDGVIAGSVAVSTEASVGDRIAQEAISFTQVGNTVTPDSFWSSVARNVVYQLGNTVSKARVRAFNGAPGQDLSTVLAGLPGITSAHKFQGIACLVIDLTYDQDAFPMGPPNVSAVVRGAKLYDPRTGTTAWTENPALIARDWALYANGGGASVSDLDDASFIAAANACDVTNSFTTVNLAGASSTQVLPIYTAGLVARTDQAPDEVLGEIVSAMAGRWAWAGGRLRVRAGTYAAPVATLTEDWVSDAGDIDVVSTLPRTELFNVLVPSIANREQGYVVSAIPRVAPAAYIAADGGEYPREVSLAAVTDTAHAAHICGVMLRDAREALTVTMSCNLRALVLELFDVVAVTLPRFGWTAKPFEVLGWSFTQEGGIKLTLKETDASIYNPDASFTRSDAAPNTGLPNPYSVPNVAPASIDSGNAQLLKQADGTILSRMRVTWAAVQDEAVRNGGSIELRYGPADSSPSTWQTETVGGTETQALLAGVQDGRVYVVTMRARNKLVAGAWSLHQSHVVRGKSAPPSDVAGLAATSAPGAVRLAWTPCPDADYALTELRVGTAWASATRIWRGTGSGFEWTAAPGSNTVLARHEDTSGNLSTGVASVSGTVLAVVSSGAALNADPNTLDASAWTGGALSVLADSAAPTGRALEITSTGATTAEAVAYPIDPSRNYQLRIHARQFSGSSTCYLGVDFQDASGASILGSTNAVGWPSGGTYFYFGLVGQQPPAAFTPYSIAFGPSETAKIPSAARYARIIILGNYVGTGVQRFSAIRLEDLTAARLASDAAAAAQSTANSAASAAAAAQSTANTASSNATSALARIAAIDSDGVLSRGEKAATILDWQALQDEEAGIVARANGYSIVTERDNYTNSKSALATYLSGLSPAWNDTSADTTIVPAVYRANWADVYAKRQTLLNKIAEVAGQRAAWGGISSRPADSALLNEYVRAGGTNLLGNSGFLRIGSSANGPIPAGWGIYNNGGIACTTTVASGGMFGQNFARITADASTTSTLGFFTGGAAVAEAVKSWVPGQTYCISVWARASSAGAAGRTISAGFSNMGFTSFNELEKPALTNDGVWRRYVAVCIPASNASTPSGELFFSYDSGGTVAAGTSFDYCCPKVELGSTPSSWTPGPLDTLNNNIAIDSGTGALTGIGSGSGQSVANNTDTLIRSPGGGQSLNNAHNTTGAIKVRLPVGTANFAMPLFYVDIYEYATGFSCTLQISGHNWSDGNWYAVSAFVVGASNVEYPVRFGRDSGGFFCVYIGDTTEVWQYPQVRVRDVTVGYASQSRDLWAANWQVTFVTSLENVSATVLDTKPGADWSKSARRPANLAALGGSEVIRNDQIGISAGGQLTGIGAGAGTVVSNNQLALSTTGVLTNAGSNQGQVVTLTVRDDVAERSTDRPPSWYPVGTTREFKVSSAVGLGGADNYLTLETVIQYQDGSGGSCYQYAYRGTTTWRRWGTCGATSWAGSWVQDLDRAAYTGDLAATRNDVYRQATDPGAVANGSIWLDTSTGKAWQRVAGAWQPYVGPGSVATGEIAADSVTVVLTSFLAGPVADFNDV